MRATLVRKELQEHAAGLAVLAVTLGLLLVLLLLGTAFGREERDELHALRSYVVLVTLFGGPAICQMLVAREFGSKTQLFLETLPVRRGTVLWTKLLLGLALQIAMVAPAVAACAALAWHSAGLDARFLLAVSARAFGFATFGYGVCFAFSFLGRYRVPCLAVAAIAFAYVVGSTDLDPSRAGPFALLDERFASERVMLPGQDLAWALGLSAFFLATGLLLGSRREGSIAALLAESMSQREKAFVSVVLVSALGAVTALDARREKKPFNLQHATRVERRGVRVELSPAGLPGGEALAERVHADLAALADLLEAPSLPPVFLAARRDIDPLRFERGTTGEADGILVRVRYPTEGWSDEMLSAWLVREVLAAHTRGRARLEPSRWLLDGAGLYWTRRGQPAAGASDLMLRALHGTSEGLSRDTLDRWLSFRERAGDDVSTAVAWSGLRTLEEVGGREAVPRLLRAALGVRPPHDARASWAAFRSPFPQAFERATGIAYGTFVQRWGAALAAERAIRSDELRAIPRLEGSLRAEQLSDATRRLSFVPEVSAGLPAGTRVKLRYAELPLFDAEIREDAVRSEDRFAPVTGAIDLPGAWARGARVAWTVSLRAEVLGCEIISGWKRQEIP